MTTRQPDVTFHHGTDGRRYARPGPAFWDGWTKAGAGWRERGWTWAREPEGKWSLNVGAPAAEVRPIPAPPDLRYYPYQEAGIRFASARPSTLIADEMGLGKTIQGLGVVNLDPHTHRRVLVITRPGLKANWVHEARTWLVDGREVTSIDAGRWPDEEPDPWLAVLGYESAHRHAEALRAKPWDLLIADEAHHLKNPDARRTRHVVGHRARRVAERIVPVPAGRKVLLTGTPIMTRPIDLHSLLHWLEPGEWGNRREFGRRYCDAHQGRFGWIESGATRLDELNARLEARIMIRRRKRDVFRDLPAKVRQTLVLAAPGRAGREALAEERRVLAALEEALRSGALRERRRHLREELAQARLATARTKVPEVVEQVRAAREAGEPQCVVFAHHHEIVDRVHEGLDPDVRAAKADGRADPKSRRAVEEAFTRGEIEVLVASWDAMGVGVNLQSCSRVVFAELDWSPSVMSQAEDRCHRIGQDRTVFVTHVVLDGSVDALIARSVTRKQRIVEEAIDGGPPEADEAMLEALAGP